LLLFPGGGLEFLVVVLVGYAVGWIFASIKKAALHQIREEATHMALLYVPNGL
jgi:hypothetical protein